MGANILLVEDEPMLQRIVGTVLKDAGHSVSQVGTAELALKRMESTEMDLVLSDKNLPGMDGIGLLQKVREQDAERGKCRAFLLATGYPTRKSALEVLAAFGDGYLVKPFRSLDAAVRQVEAALKSDLQARHQSCALARAVVARLEGAAPELPAGSAAGVFVSQGVRQERLEKTLRVAGVFVAREELAEHEGPTALVSDDVGALEALRAACPQAALVYADNGANFPELLRLIDAGGCAVLARAP